MSNVELFRFFSDAPGVGHHGGGDVGLTIRRCCGLVKANPCMQKSCEED